MQHHATRDQVRARLAAERAGENRAHVIVQLRVLLGEAMLMPHTCRKCAYRTPTRANLARHRRERNH